MKQVLQNYRDGSLAVAEVPAPTIERGRVLVRNHASLISAGTERSTISFAQKSLAGKAITRMDLVAKVVAKARTDGIQETLRMVRSRLDVPAALGYSCAGEVIEVGAGVDAFKVGDRVACAGQNYASHAEFVSIPRNLCVRIPNDVTFDDAAYVTLGAIALQGVRQAATTLGEVVLVIGLGLLGQLTVQLLRAAGCRVVASDPVADRCRLAIALGAHSACSPNELNSAVAAMTDGHGADAVIVTASSTSDEPIRQAAELSRKKGRVVVVGAVPMNLPREPFYVRELELRLSMSYGPGRYDPAYEENGRDYPYAFVRWTENRNMQAFLELLEAKRIDVGRLTTHRFPVEAASDAYRLVTEGTEPCLGVVLHYLQNAGVSPARRIQLRQGAVSGRIGIGLIGVGNHVMDRLVPHIAGASGGEISGVCSGTGKNAKRVAEQLNAQFATTDYAEILAHSETNAVVIGTRDNLHAEIVIAALAAGKHVLVEKPLCVSEAELDRVTAAYDQVAGAIRLFVGYNRRYSRHVEAVRDFVGARETPLMMSYRVNAGGLPRDHWIFDTSTSAGRVVNEVGHFVDCLQSICRSRVATVSAIAPRNDETRGRNEAVLSLGFANGSAGTIVYAANGDKALPKERCEIFGDGCAAVIDDFRTTEFFRSGKRTVLRTGRQDKGFEQEVAAFLAAIRDPNAPGQDFADLHAISLTTLRAVESVSSGLSYRLASQPGLP